MAKETTIELQTEAGLVQYRLISMKPRKAARIGMRLTRLIGKPLGELASAMDSKGSKSGNVLDMDLGSDNFKGAIQTFLADLTEEKFDKLIVDLWDSDRIKYYTEESEKWRPVSSVDNHFDKFDVEHMLEVMYHIIRFNYGGLIKKLWGLVGSEDGGSAGPRLVAD